MLQVIASSRMYTRSAEIIFAQKTQRQLYISLQKNIYVTEITAIAQNVIKYEDDIDLRKLCFNYSAL